MTTIRIRYRARCVKSSARSQSTARTSRAKLPRAWRHGAVSALYARKLRFPERRAPKILEASHREQGSEEYSKRYFNEVSNLDEPTQLQYVDMHTWMIYDILLKADRMSMANSLELRVPFLDKKMLELSTRIPSRYRAANETTKIALRGAAIKQLPERTANKKKLGFLFR